MLRQLKLVPFGTGYFFSLLNKRLSLFDALLTSGKGDKRRIADPCMA